MLDEIIRSERKQLPIILLLDTSGSMEGYRIEALNSAVKDMLNSFVEEENIRAEIQVSIITFGGEAKLHTDITPVKDIIWSDLIADGLTPMGDALDIAKEMIEDRKKIKIAPNVVVVSDGMPNDKDEWYKSLENFMEGRSRKCTRWAMAIGDGANKELLKEFVSDDDKYVFEASDASQIKKFFKVVTMSTLQRSKTGNSKVVSGDFKKMFDIIDEYEDEEDNEDYF